MTVGNMAEALSFTACALPHPDRKVTGAYCGDLLSWVMSRANSGSAWITIMTSINAVAVACLADVSCIVLAEGVAFSDKDLETAKEKGVNVVSSPLPAYETAVAIARLLDK